MQKLPRTATLHFRQGLPRSPQPPGAAPKTRVLQRCSKHRAATWAMQAAARVLPCRPQLQFICARASTKQTLQHTGCSDFYFCCILQKLDCFPTVAGEVQHQHLSSCTKPVIALQETALEARLPCRLTAVGWEGTSEGHLRSEAQLVTSDMVVQSAAGKAEVVLEEETTSRHQHKRAHKSTFPNIGSTSPPPFPRLGLIRQICRPSNAVAPTHGEGPPVQFLREALLQGCCLLHDQSSPGN